MTNPQVWMPAGGSTDIFAGTVYAGQIAAGAIGTAELAAGSIVADKIAAGAIVAGAIAAGAVSAETIAAGSIAAAHIASDAIVAGNIAAGAIGVDELAARAITAAKIATGTITANEIAGRTITAEKLVALSVTAAEIAANTITADKLVVSSVQAAVVTAAAVNALTITAANITGGNISGVNITGQVITGGTVRTSTGLRRVEIASDDTVYFYDGVSGHGAGRLIADYGYYYSGFGKGLAMMSALTLHSPVDGSGTSYLRVMGHSQVQVGGDLKVSKRVLSDGAVMPNTECVSGVSDDGVWVNDLNNADRRWKLYMTNNGGSYQLVARYGSGGSEYRTIGP
jgi:hypothetical protein